MATWINAPGLSRQDFSSKGGSFTRPPAIIALHSTEGSNYPSAATYNNGGSAPHFTINPKQRSARQHFPLSMSACALVNKTGGVQTNRGGAIQFELIGYAKNIATAYNNGDWDYVATIVKAAADACGIPLTSTVSWVAYPASYGLKAKQRLSNAAWNAYRGILGHQHVPENDHGDPGNIWGPLSAALARVGAGTKPSAPSAPSKPAGTPAPNGVKDKRWYGTNSYILARFATQLSARGWSVRLGQSPYIRDSKGNKIGTYTYLTQFGNDGIWGPEYQTLLAAFRKDQGLPGGRSMITERDWDAAMTGPVTA
jgi:hypothetical protein